MTGNRSNRSLAAHSVSSAPSVLSKPREDATPSTSLSAFFRRCSSASLSLCGETRSSRLEGMLA
jgi:hypothetical protein